MERFSVDVYRMQKRRIRCTVDFREASDPGQILSLLVCVSLILRLFLVTISYGVITCEIKQLPDVLA